VYRFLLSWDPSKELSLIPGHLKEFSRVCIVLASDISRKRENFPVKIIQRARENENQVSL
jgi:hypothetical protein